MFTKNLANLIINEEIDPKSLFDYHIYKYPTFIGIIEDLRLYVREYAREYDFGIAISGFILYEKQNREKLLDYKYLKNIFYKTIPEIEDLDIIISDLILKKDIKIYEQIKLL